MDKTQVDSGSIRVERVRDRGSGFEETVREDRIHRPIRTDEELEEIENTITSLSSWDRVDITFGQAFGPVDETDEFDLRSDADVVTRGKTVEAIVDEIRVDVPPEQNTIRSEWDIELLLLRGTGTDGWDLRSVTGIGGQEAPWHVYTYPYKRDTGECQPRNAVTSGWILDIERL